MNLPQSKTFVQAKKVFNLLEENYSFQHSKLKQAQETYKKAIDSNQQNRDLNAQLWKQISQLTKHFKNFMREKHQRLSMCKQKVNQNFQKIQKKLNEQPPKYFYVPATLQMNFPQIQVPQSIVQKQKEIEEQQKQQLDLIEDDVTKIKIKIQLTQIQIRQFESTFRSQKRRPS